MAIATAIGGNLFNLLYGRIYDAHSIRDTTGSMTCIVGRQCYRSAYHVAFGAATLGVCCCLWSIRRDYLVHKGRDPDRARIA